MKLLIIEDDDSLAQLLTRGFSEEDFQTDRAADGLAGLEKGIAGNYDCILLDLMLPKMNGLDVCRNLRQKGIRSPILMLTVKGSTEDKVLGLSEGADDYVVKPFSFEELLARVQALVRRHRDYASRTLHFEDLEVDLITRTIQRAGKPIDLTPKEFDLLEYFLRHPERVITEKELLENIWSVSFDPRTNIVNVYMHHLREKIDRPFRRPLIVTVRGSGWRLGGEE